jgi:hypothetical protein
MHSASKKSGQLVIEREAPQGDLVVPGNTIFFAFAFTFTFRCCFSFDRFDAHA